MPQAPGSSSSATIFEQESPQHGSSRTGAAPCPEATDAAGSRITIATTGLTAQIAAEAGGRLARLSWRRRSGQTVDIVLPMTSGLAPPGWPKAGPTRSFPTPTGSHRDGCRSSAAFMMWRPIRTLIHTASTAIPISSRGPAPEQRRTGPTYPSPASAARHGPGPSRQDSASLCRRIISSSPCPCATWIANPCRLASAGIPTSSPPDRPR